MSRSELDARKAEQWFRRRGLPAVVRGLEENLTARIVPAVVWLALFETLYKVLTLIDGDAAFSERLENDLFLLLYTVALVGTVVFPVISAWLAAGWARDRVLDNRGFLPALVLVVGYVVVGTVADVVLEDSEPWTALLEYLFEVGVLYGLTAIGVGSILGWALRAALRQLRSVGTMTSRAMPLLLVTTFGFFTAEIWQSAGQISAARWR